MSEQDPAQAEALRPAIGMAEFQGVRAGSRPLALSAQGAHHPLLERMKSQLHPHLYNVGAWHHPMIYTLAGAAA